MATIEEQRARAKKMGIPMPITQMSEGVAIAPVTTANSDKHSRLAALKSGANKKGMQDLVNSKSAQDSFQGIPEATQKRKPNPNNPNQPSNMVSPGKSVVPKGHSAPVNSELSAIDAMFGGGGGGAVPAPSVGGNAELNYDSVGPTFNPAAELAKKNAMAHEPQVQEQGPDYKQYAVNPESQNQNMTQENFDFQNMQRMMQEIAKKTISEVLNEYTEKQKNKLAYENYTKTKDGAQVIKTNSGKYFKLTPVKITRS